MWSFSSIPTGVGPFSSAACGMATFRPEIEAEWRGRLEAMPAFFRIRSVTKSSQVLPLTASMTSPAAM